MHYYIINKVHSGIESSFLLDPSGAFPLFHLSTGPDQTLNIFCIEDINSRKLGVLELHAAAAFKPRQHKMQCFLLNIREVIYVL